MVPLIEAEVVDKRKWISKEDFLDLMALAQTVPGIFAVNIAIFIGYKLRKLRGALAMALGTILPSFLIILAGIGLSGGHISPPPLPLGCLSLKS